MAHSQLPLPLWERAEVRGNLINLVMQIALADRAGLFTASKLDAFFEPLAHSRFHELAYRAETLAAAFSQKLVALADVAALDIKGRAAVLECQL